ncbi:hypothetical protein ACWF8M_29795 [Streptomyces sp. NPDC055008]
MHIRRSMTALALTGAAAGALAFGASPASAAASAITYDCTSTGQVCIYYNSSSYGYGAVFRQTSDVPNYAGRYFSAGRNGSAGAGVEVKNHAAAVDSWVASNFTVYFNSNYDCSVACQTVSAYNTVNLNANIKNNTASGRVT